MIENIEKIRQKIAKLLNQIADLKAALVDKDKQHDAFVVEVAMRIIAKIDNLDDKAQARLAEAESDAGKDAILALHAESVAPLKEILDDLGVIELPSPLDIMEGFCEVVGTQPNKYRKDGVVVRVIRPGYSRNDELLRPSHVISVKN